MTTKLASKVITRWSCADASSRTAEQKRPLAKAAKASNNESCGSSVGEAREAVEGRSQKVRVVETVLDPGVSVLGANPGCIVKLDGDNRREKPLEEIVVSTELLFCWARARSRLPSHQHPPCSPPEGQSLQR